MPKKKAKDTKKVEQEVADYTAKNQEVIEAESGKSANDIFYRRLAKRLGVPIKDRKTLEDVMLTIALTVQETVAIKGSFTMPGLCTVKATEVGEREGTIQFGPKKGEKYVTPAHIAPKFVKPDGSFKDLLNGKEELLAEDEVVTLEDEESDVEETEE